MNLKIALTSLLLLCAFVTKSQKLMKETIIRNSDSIKSVYRSNSTIGLIQMGIQHPIKPKLQKQLINDLIIAVDSLRDLQLRQAELDELLRNTYKNGYLVTPRNFDTIAAKQFRAISGTEIKNGKYIGQSVSVDEKSLTANFTIRPWISQEFYIQPNISGTAKESFIDVVSEGKYSRHFTGGLNFTRMIPFTSSWFYPKSKFNVHNDLNKLRTDYNDKTKTETVKKYTGTRDSLMQILKRSEHYLEAYNSALIDIYSTPNLQSKKDLISFGLYADTLILAGLLPKRYKELDVPNQLSVLDSVSKTRIEKVALGKFLEITDQVQQKAKFTIHILSWVTVGFKYNQGNHFVQDTIGDALKRGVRDEYISLNASYTIVFANSKSGKLFFSPTLTLNNKHNYDSDKEIKAYQFEDYVIGKNTVQKISKDLTIYPNVPDRLNSFGLELPLAFYSAAYRFGAEVTYKWGRNDPDNDNESAKFGIFIPFKASDNTQIIIEPIIKFNKLNQSGLKFWKEQFSFGLNLSVALPKGLFK